MQIPKRRSQLLRKHEERDNYLTPEKIERLKQDLERTRIERPKIVEDLANAMKLGDFSENAEYQDAKARLSRMDGRIFNLKERIKNAIPIEIDPTMAGKVQVGSTVTLEVAGQRRVYEIVGSQESDPTRGRISRVSPLGSALLGCAIGEKVQVETGAGTKEYLIVEIS